MRSEQINAWAQLLAGVPASRIDGPRTAAGRLNLRGLNVPVDDGQARLTYASPVRALLPHVEVQSAVWEGVDFSGSTLNRLRLRKAILRDCSFDACKFHLCTIWSPEILNCSFVKSRFRESYFSACLALPEGKISNCSFVGADFRGSSHGLATYTDCDFSEVNLNRVELNGSAFINAQFSGTLRETMFSSRGPFQPECHPHFRFDNVDWTECDLVDISFRWMPLGKVRFPHNDRHVIFTLRGAQAALSAIGAGDDVQRKLGRIWFEYCLKFPPPDLGITGVLYVPNYRKLVGDELADRVIAVLNGHR